MKIVFMGTPAFAVPSLDILLKNNYEIQTVVTVPDKEKGRGLKVQYSDVKNFSLENNLKILQPISLKDNDFINEIKSKKPDLIVVVAFRILPKEVYSIPVNGSINLHASLLPKYRGAAPINWAIINGEKETGVTTFFLKDKVDTGNLILQKKIYIDNNDNAGTIHDKLSILGADALLETVKMIESGNSYTKQQSDELSSKAPKIFKENCIINWNTYSRTVHNLIRGLSPYPSAFTHFENKVLKILSSEITDIKPDDKPGMLFSKDKKLFVNTLDYLLEIKELQLEGKKRISAKEFINGLERIKYSKILLS